MDEKIGRRGFAPAQFRLGFVCLVGEEAGTKNEIEALAWRRGGSKCAEEFLDEQTQKFGRGVVIDSHDVPSNDRRVVLREAGVGAVVGKLKMV